MKKNFFEIKIIFLIAFAIIAVFAAGFLAYKSINFVLLTIKKESQPKLSLVVLKEVKNNLLIGESNIEYYALTRDSKYIKPYKRAQQNVDEKLSMLYAYNHGNTLRTYQIDSISLLIDKKFRLWERMLTPSSPNRIDDAFDKISDAIDKASDTLTLKIRNNITVETKDTSDLIENKVLELPERKESFFSRIFKKKEEEEEEIPIILPRTPSPNIVLKPVDTSIAIGVNKSELQEEIMRLKQQEGEKTSRLTAYEVSLRQQNNQITLQLEKLISKIEKEEWNEIRKKAVEADKMVEETNKWAMIFLLLFIALLIGVIYVIQKYVRKTYTTQLALTKAKNAALKLSQTKERFLANMSHEIRTPMNAIVGFTEQVLQMPLDNGPKEHIEIVKKSADHLLQIINDILDFSKLESGKLKLEKLPFNINALLNQAYQLYKPSADLNSTQLSIDPVDSHYILRGDSFRLKQILFNLISNAVKFTNKGMVHVSAKTLVKSPEVVDLVIEIKDTGIGIPENQLKSIFEEFTQAESSTSRNYGGTGLGLAIVRKLVHLHGGTISAKNNPHGGSCFTVSITYEIGEEKDFLEMEKTHEENTGLLKGLKFLVADDDDYNCKLIELIFSKCQLSFKIVQSGKDTIKALHDENFDLLLLDIHMPRMNGFEVARKIRKEFAPPAKNIPIIAVTATISKEEIRECNQAGINDILSKPFTEQQLFQKITDIVSPPPQKGDHLKLPTRKTSKAGNGQVSQKEFKDLYDMAGGVKDFVEDMLRIFITTTEEGVEDLKDAYSQKDWLNLAEYAHKIKAPCKHLDAEPLSILLKKLELKARNGGNEKLIAPLYQKSLKEIDALTSRVKNHLKEHFPAGNPPS